MIIITVCMGSSCFSRGNSANAEIIKQYIQAHHLEEKVAVKGCLCESKCKTGPHIRIGDKIFDTVSPDGLEDLLAHELGNAR